MQNIQSSSSPQDDSHYRWSDIFNGTIDGRKSSLPFGWQLYCLWMLLAGTGLYLGLGGFLGVLLVALMVDLAAQALAPYMLIGGGAVAGVFVLWLYIYWHVKQAKGYFVYVLQHPDASVSMQDLYNYNNEKLKSLSSYLRRRTAYMLDFFVVMLFSAVVCVLLGFHFFTREDISEADKPDAFLIIFGVLMALHMILQFMVHMRKAAEE